MIGEVIFSLITYIDYIVFIKRLSCPYVKVIGLSLHSLYKGHYSKLFDGSDGFHVIQCFLARKCYMTRKISKIFLIYFLLELLTFCS